MILGVITWDLALPGCSSLKEKRSVIKSLRERMHNRFNVSVSETDFHDVADRARLSAAVVAGSRAHADSVLDKVDSFVERDGRAVLIRVKRELL